MTNIKTSTNSKPNKVNLENNMRAIDKYFERMNKGRQ